ncbi:MAG: hypothetical protein ABI867_45380, partial [Kofleriaceae bacterium]
ADADDADLLAAHGEADRPSHSDFAARLDLDDSALDDSDLGDSNQFARVPSDPDFYAAAPHFVDPRIAHSASHALAAFEEDDRHSAFPPIGRNSPGHTLGGQPIFEDQGSVSYTLAGEPSPAESLEFDAPHAGFANQFDQSDVIDIGQDQVRANRRSDDEPQVLRAPPPGKSRTRDDLESALEALDVDLDDLSIPHASTELVRDTGGSERGPRPTIRPPSSSQQARQPARRAKRQSDSDRPSRPVSDDGIMIDFDDEEAGTK